MKLPLIVCLAVVCGGLLPASGQNLVPPSHSHSLSLQVVPVGKDGAEVAQSNDAIKITVKNFGTVANTAQVEWYFVAEPIRPMPGKAGAGQTFVSDHGAQSVSLAAGAQVKIVATAKEMTAEVAKPTPTPAGRGKKGKREMVSEPKATVKETGGKPSGWMVRVAADSKVIDAEGSTPTLKEIAKEDARIAAMTKK